MMVIVFGGVLLLQVAQSGQYILTLMENALQLVEEVHVIDLRCTKCTRPQGQDLVC